MKRVEFHGHDFSWTQHAAKCRQILQADAKPRGDQQELDHVARVKWDEFHQRNKGRVYKPRNYLTKEFPELADDKKQVILEIGCGYGSSLFPILKQNPSLRAFACDFSAHAIDILKQHEEYNPERCHAFVCDVAKEALQPIVQANSVDLVLMVFVLSALPPETFASVLGKVRDVLKPGGIVCFRDYGLYDLAMMRSPNQLSESLYFRSDGTLAYFFSQEDLQSLVDAPESGLEILENEYNTVRLHNRKTKVAMNRVWLHAKFRKAFRQEQSEIEAGQKGAKQLGAPIYGS